MNMLQATAMYVKLRDRKAVIKKKHQLELKPFNEKMDRIEAAILKIFNKTKQLSTRTEAGTPYITERVTITIVDRDAYLAYVIREGAYEFFTNAASKPAVENYIAEHGALPPGIKRTVEKQINVKRS